MYSIPLAVIPMVVLMAACSTASPEPADALVRVIDGDTLVATVAGTEESVRLLGVNAPEIGECFGQEAKRALEELVADRGLTLERDHTDRDASDRLLRHVYANGDYVAEHLVEGGFALAHAVGDDRSHADRLERAEQSAKGAGAGWWGPEACGPARRSAVEIVGWQPDPPGRDVESLEHESVSFTNVADQPVSLAGWILRDASSSHRYLFADDVMVRPGETLTVFSGCGTDSRHSLYWCHQRPIWDNLSDDILLLNERGGIAAHVDYNVP